ncbi:unnamed protein product [Polarella glacialis]|uniref:Secreted protein n=1 Tax=Polarella glacialis TaxID=89957 RepID=A0A813DGD3_POLGL|nr:unnamed protein product [Polarella glacialis]
MAAVKLIKFVAVAILASSSAAEPTNSTCAGQDQDEIVALQVGEQSHDGTCICGVVCPPYKHCSGGTCKYSCSDAKESYLASNPPGLDQEAFSQASCTFYSGNLNCWSYLGGALSMSFKQQGNTHPCPAGFQRQYDSNPCSIHYETSLDVVCPKGWCECRKWGCGCKARGTCDGYRRRRR